MSSYPYIWRWGPGDGERPELGQYKGKRCRVIHRGRRNSVLIEFEDGAQFVASGNGLRRAPPVGADKNN